MKENTHHVSLCCASFIVSFRYASFVIYFSLLFDFLYLNSHFENFGAQDRKRHHSHIAQLGCHLVFSISSYSWYHHRYCYGLDAFCLNPSEYFYCWYFIQYHVNHYQIISRHIVNFILIQSYSYFCIPGKMAYDRTHLIDQMVDSQSIFDQYRSDALLVIRMPSQLAFRLEMDCCSF